MLEWALFPHWDPAAFGSLPCRLRVAPGSWQIPCPGKDRGAGRLCRTALGSPGCTPTFTPCSHPWERREGGVSQGEGCIGGDPMDVTPRQEISQLSRHNISGFLFLSFPGLVYASWRFSSWTSLPGPDLSLPALTDPKSLCTLLDPAGTCLFAGHWLGTVSVCGCEKGQLRLRLITKSKTSDVSGTCQNS